MRSDKPPALFPLPPPKCSRCFTDLTRPIDVLFGECTPCNHAGAAEQLLNVLRGWWQRHPDRRDLIKAWADHVQAGHTVSRSSPTPPGATVAGTS